ncbi:hypothetical protein V9T40_014167 [Parthenolecanium corni]|uniref:Uncharacterized protein n=1 Tax=Parthenolecanium corni TaxID=536013 RepID=A0AAN9TE84_9HEMI
MNNEIPSHNISNSQANSRSRTSHWHGTTTAKIFCKSVAISGRYSFFRCTKITEDERNEANLRQVSFPCESRLRERKT